MFSNRSVRVQPSAAPIEKVGVPDARTVLAALRNAGHVFGGFEFLVVVERCFAVNLPLTLGFGCPLGATGCSSLRHVSQRRNQPPGAGNHE